MSGASPKTDSHGNARWASISQHAEHTPFHDQQQTPPVVIVVFVDVYDVDNVGVQAAPEVQVDFSPRLGRVVENLGSPAQIQKAQ